MHRCTWIAQHPELATDTYGISQVQDIVCRRIKVSARMRITLSKTGKIICHQANTIIFQHWCFYSRNTFFIRIWCQKLLAVEKNLFNTNPNRSNIIYILLPVSLEKSNGCGIMMVCLALSAVTPSWSYAICLPSGSIMRVALGGCLWTFLKCLMVLLSPTFKHIAAYTYHRTVKKESYTTKMPKKENEERGLHQCRQTSISTYKNNHVFRVVHGWAYPGSKQYTLHTHFRSLSSYAGRQGKKTTVQHKVGTFFRRLGSHIGYERN